MAGPKLGGAGPGGLTVNAERREARLSQATAWRIAEEYEATRPKDERSFVEDMFDSDSPERPVEVSVRLRGSTYRFRILGGQLACWLAPDITN